MYKVSKCNYCVVERHCTEEIFIHLTVGYWCDDNNKMICHRFSSAYTVDIIHIHTIYLCIDLFYGQP